MRFKAGSIFCIVVLLSVAAWASGPTYTVLYTFQGYPSDGSGPWNVGTLLRDASGNIYGTTHDGGSTDCGGTTGGVLFELSRGKETLLHDFGTVSCGLDGLVPTGAAIMDSAGNLYGTTAGGGAGDCGTVWEWESSSSTLVDLASTGCSTAWGPVGGVIMDQSGNLYGTAVTGGASPNGVVYEVSSGVVTVLYGFTGGSDGGDPRSGLVMDSEGNLYGTTVGGGEYGAGTVFELSNSGGVWTESVLHSFNDSSNSDGAYPEDGNLTLAGNPLGSVIYGVTGGGGSAGGGTVFRMVKAKKGYNFSLVHSFTGTGGDGQDPHGTIALVRGKLYGTTVGGGTSGFGTVFELTRGTTGWTETSLYNFTNGADGSTPIAGLAADSKGNLYGAAYSGGSFAGCSQGCGVVFKVRP